MNDSIKLSSNMEDYLEAIADLLKEKGIARVKDISKVLNVKKPSVAAALSTLSKKKLIVHEKYGYIELTSSGEKLAQDICERHEILFQFLTKILKVDPKIAGEEACKMEHSISPDTLKKFRQFLKRFDNK
jgi:DtxR family Mn-dependent transcriptional regulator